MSSPTSKQLLEMHAQLLKIRRFEERIIQFSMSGKVAGWLHSYLGQEAVSVGVVSNLRKDDWILATHRGRGHLLAKGLDSRRYVAEVMAKKTGTCEGRAGEMHLAEKDIGIAGSSGIVGGFISTALGFAFAQQYLGTDRVAVSFFGDGASNQGSFHESLNLASVWNLPVVFVVENNQWAEWTCRSNAMRIEKISQRAQAYGIPGVTVDGDDLMAVYDAAQEAIARARQGKGTTLLECLTHRWTGHFIGDPQDYRDPEDVEKARSFDPVSRFQAKLMKEGVLTKDKIDELEAKLKAEIDDAIQFAENSPWPDVADLTKNVYKEG